MATITGLNLITPRVIVKASDNSSRTQLTGSVHLNHPWKVRSARNSFGRLLHVRPVRAAPDSISDKVEKSVEDAKQTCADDPQSGECAAAWDEVEELSAAASHARDKKKAGGSDPLENYCKDNPETDECRTYDN